MKIIEPIVELWKQEENPIAHVARCARVCYGKEEGDDEQLYKVLLKNKHHSMFRHESMYFVIPLTKLNYDFIKAFRNSPYIDFEVYDDEIYIATNRQFFNENIDVSDYISILNYQVHPDIFESSEVGFNLMRYTFKVTTQISTSRELNRVSPNSIAERSTRYVYEDGSIVKPWWLIEYDNYKYNSDIYNNAVVRQYLDIMQSSFDYYESLIKEGVRKEDARGVLPLDTATECVYTYSIKEWRHIIDLRYYGTTGRPHPNALKIAGMIRDELIKLGYNFK